MLFDSEFIAAKLRRLRASLIQVDALPQLSVMAILIGAGTGLIIVLFRLALESSHILFSMQSTDDFESLSASARVMLIMGGSITIGIALQSLSKYQGQMSVGHVIDRLHNHQGKLPFTNWIAQFVLGIVALASGHCAGREGPAVHLGAGVSSFFGRWLQLPNNSMQTLIACGVAAAIAACFDTPLAGVIFAMEVIVMEYTIVGFVPVILASVIGSAVSKSLLGGALAFGVNEGSMNSLAEMGIVVMSGLVIACFAGAYIHLHILTLKFSKFSPLVRLLIAGALTSAVAVFVPEIMGMGYDTIQLSLSGNIVPASILLIALAKLFVTPIVTGLGTPGGLIGPSLFVGACVGAAIGASASLAFPSLNIDTNLYVLLCMTGMMAAVLNAPLAALIAILELSDNPNVIFPAMLMIVIACISTRQVFKVRSIFIEQLVLSGRDIEMGPASRALRATSVMKAMDRRVAFVEHQLNLDQAKQALNSQPKWILFTIEEVNYALWAPDLAHFIDSAPQKIIDGEALIELNEVPGRRHLMHAVLESESLYDALKIMKKTQCQVLYVSSRAYSRHSIHGVVTFEAVQNHYQPKGFTSALG